MNLKEQLEIVTNENTALDAISINYKKGKRKITLIIKTSVLILHQMMSKLGNRNIIVFPECQETSLYFLVASIIYNISVGEMSMQYDPHLFSPGEKLKIGNCIVEFVSCGVENIQGNSVERIRVKYAGDNGSPVVISLPLDNAPFFQKVNTNRRLSTDKKVTEAIRHQKKLVTDNNFIELLKKHKTHMDSSMTYVSSIAKTKDFFANAGLNVDCLISQAGIGDIMLTCLSGKSRNRTFGELLGNDKEKAKEYQKNTTIEGFDAMFAIKKFCDKKGIKFKTLDKIINIVNDVLS